MSGGSIGGSGRITTRLGEMAFACAGEDCLKVADLVIRGPKRTELPLCHEHWDYLSGRVRGLIEVVRALDRPICFRRDCGDEAVAVMEDVAGPARPVCQRHLDDLSWVDVSDLATVVRPWEAPRGGRHA